MSCSESESGDSGSESTGGDSQGHAGVGGVGGVGSVAVGSVGDGGGSPLDLGLSGRSGLLHFSGGSSAISIVSGSNTPLDRDLGVRGLECGGVSDERSEDESARVLGGGSGNITLSILDLSLSCRAGGVACESKCTSSRSGAVNDSGVVGLALFGGKSGSGGSRDHVERRISSSDGGLGSKSGEQLVSKGVLPGNGAGGVSSCDLEGVAVPGSGATSSSSSDFLADVGLAVVDFGVVLLGDVLEDHVQVLVDGRLSGAGGGGLSPVGLAIEREDGGGAVDEVHRADGLDVGGEGGSGQKGGNERFHLWEVKFKL